MFNAECLAGQNHGRPKQAGTLCPKPTSNLPFPKPVQVGRDVPLLVHFEYSTEVAHTRWQSPRWFITRTLLVLLIGEIEPPIVGNYLSGKRG